MRLTESDAAWAYRATADPGIWTRGYGETTPVASEGTTQRVAATRIKDGAKRKYGSIARVSAKAIDPKRPAPWHHAGTL